MKEKCFYCQDDDEDCFYCETFEEKLERAYQKSVTSSSNDA